MQQQLSSEKGVTIVECIVALGVLSVTMLGVAAVFTQGMSELNSSPAGVIMTQKATQAVEAVFAARDSHKLTWSQIRNVAGANNDGGVFLDGAQPVKIAGLDGLVNTADDGVVECIPLPGPDQLIGTADDTAECLSSYTRQIKIRDIANTPLNCGTVALPCVLRSIEVTITYQDGATKRTYVLTTYVSNWA